MSYLIKRCFVIVVFSQFLAGCGNIGKKHIYYWEDYSAPLYAFKKTPDQKNRRKYEESLKNIIDVSGRKGKRVPPGIFAEYGYREAQKGKTNEAAKYFDMEEKSYPESKAFVKHLRERFIRFDLK